MARLVDELLACPGTTTASEALNLIFGRFWYQESARRDARLDREYVASRLEDYRLEMEVICPDAVEYEPDETDVAQTARRLIDHLLTAAEPTNDAAFALLSHRDGALLDDVIEVVEQRMSDPSLELLVTNCFHLATRLDDDATEDRVLALAERIAVEAASPAVREAAEDYLRHHRK